MSIADEPLDEPDILQLGRFAPIARASLYRQEIQRLQHLAGVGDQSRSENRRLHDQLQANAKLLGFGAQFTRFLRHAIAASKQSQEIQHRVNFPCAVSRGRAQLRELDRKRVATERVACHRGQAQGRKLRRECADDGWWYYERSEPVLQHEARAFAEAVQGSAALNLEQRVINTFCEARHNPIIDAICAPWGIIRGMCLAVPGRIESIDGERGTIRVGGVTVEAILALVPYAKVGDYAVVHAGYAIQLLSPEEAEETLDLMRQVLEMEEASAGNDA